jgi:hypothetical protein
VIARTVVADAAVQVHDDGAREHGHKVAELRGVHRSGITVPVISFYNSRANERASSEGGAS